MCAWIVYTIHYTAVKLGCGVSPALTDKQGFLTRTCLPEMVIEKIKQIVF